MKVVLDANVLLAGLATHGLCESLLLVCYRDHAVVLSHHLLDEVRAHLVSKFRVKPRRASASVATLRRHSAIVIPDALAPGTRADADDLPVLGTATACRADFLVTGDAGLLTLGSCRGVSIVSPRDFYSRIRR